MFRVLIVTRNFGVVSKDEYKMFTNRGYEIAPNPLAGKRLNEDELISLIKDVDVAYVGNDPVTVRVLESAKRLKVVNKSGIGVDNIDVKAASRLGIAVTCVPGANADSVADHTFALMLAVARNVPQTCNIVKLEGRWPVYHGIDVSGKILGLVGLGEIGKKVALRAIGFHMKVLAYDPYPDMNFVANNSIELCDSIDALIPRVDIFSLHFPHTEETTKIINRSRVDALKRGAIFINAARGKLVDEDALYDALSEGRLWGAGLDVVDEEPPKARNRLFNLDNVVVTPHSAGISYDALSAMSRLSVENIVGVLERNGEGCPCFFNKNSIENMRALHIRKDE